MCEIHHCAIRNKNGESKMENIIQAIAEAEEKALSIKQEAAARAEEIVSLAERAAAEKEKNSREDCKQYRAAQLDATAKEAEAKYTADVSSAAAKARLESEEQMKKVDSIVARIVGRIIRGDC